MTVRRLPKTRQRLDEFTVAKLYLEDVRDITEILIGDSAVRDLKYRVRDFECDSVDELEEIGGSARSFAIIATNSEGDENVLRLE